MEEPIIPEEAPEETPEDTSKDVPVETPEDTSKDDPVETPEEVQEETPDDVPEEVPKETPKYVHNCTKCGQCCEKWSEIPIYLEDLQRWMGDSTIQYVLPFIQLQEVPPFYVKLILQKEEKEDDTNPSGCPLYDHENKICNVYTSMPLHCSSYPLAYNGEKYYLVDRDSPGLGSGLMTSESLDLARKRARDHFTALSSSGALLPLLYTLIVNEIMRKSQEAVSSMTEEDQQKLEELLSKSEEEEQVAQAETDVPEVEDVTKEENIEE